MQDRQRRESTGMLSFPSRLHDRDRDRESIRWHKILNTKSSFFMSEQAIISKSWLTHINYNNMTSLHARPLVKGVANLLLMLTCRKWILIKLTLKNVRCTLSLFPIHIGLQTLLRSLKHGFSRHNTVLHQGLVSVYVTPFSAQAWLTVDDISRM